MDPITEDFICLVEGCGKRFKRKEHLVRHGTSHNEVKAFVCGVCSKGFARSDVLNRHVRQHGPDASSTASSFANLNACDACHIRKAKCVGGDPCHFCSEHNVQCTRDRAVSRRRATKEVQESLRNPAAAAAVSQPKYAEDQVPMIAWGEDLPMEDANLEFSSTSPSTVDPGLHEPSSVKVSSAFDGLPFSLPPGISETSSIESKDGDLLIEVCSRSWAGPIGETPYAMGIAEGLLDHFLVAYFTHLYQRWPIIHCRTFDKRNSDPQLLWTMLMIGARCSPQQKGARELADHLQGDLPPILVRYLQAEQAALTHDMMLLLPKLQSAILYIMHAVYFGDDQEVIAVCHIVELVLSCLRRIGAYDPQVWTKEIPWADPMSRDWLQIETRKRLTSMSFFADAYLAILLDKAPSLSYEDLNCRLPCRNYWWWAMSREEVSRLRMADRPSDRTPKTMHSFISDTLAEDKTNADVDVRELEVVDCHLVQCAIHLLVWSQKEQARARVAARDAVPSEQASALEDPECDLSESQRAL